MTSAIIVAAGIGKRFGPDADKLFFEVAGRPVVAHTWLRFDHVSAIDEVILVVRGGMEPVFEALATGLEILKPWRLVPGGQQRQNSVWNGLQATSSACEIVAVQDGARPCTSMEVIRATLEAARESGAAVAAQRVTDTLKESDDGRVIARTVDRSRLWAVQTPQAFRRSVLLDALGEVRQRGLQVTDDTAACELTGHPVRLVESTAPNPKVTFRGDLPWLEVLLRGAGVGQ